MTLNFFSSTITIFGFRVSFLLAHKWKREALPVKCDHVPLRGLMTPKAFKTRKQVSMNVFQLPKLVKRETLSLS